jgi:AraC-like DNA-binding protein
LPAALLLVAGLLVASALLVAALLVLGLPVSVALLVSARWLGEPGWGPALPLVGGQLCPQLVERVLLRDECLRHVVHQPGWRLLHTLLDQRLSVTIARPTLRRRLTEVLEEFLDGLPVLLVHVSVSSWDVRFPDTVQPTVRRGLAYAAVPRRDRRGRGAFFSRGNDTVTAWNTERVIDEFATRRPGDGLRQYVTRCTGYRQAGVEPAVHRGLPSPWLTMIVTLDEPLVVARHPDPRQPASKHDFLLGGLHTSPALVTHDGWQSGIQLALSPLGARALLGMPAAELAGIDVEAADVFGGLADEIREQVLAECDWAGRFAVLERVIAGRVRAAREPGAQEPKPEVSYAWERLLTSHGTVSVADLSAETGWSARHLREQFRAETGLSPKAAARVVRFDRARHRLLGQDAGGQVALAALAAESGYYDQAHLAREFRDLAGCPPSVLFAEERRNVQAGLLIDEE